MSSDAFAEPKEQSIKLNYSLTPTAQNIHSFVGTVISSNQIPHGYTYRENSYPYEKYSENYDNAKYNAKIYAGVRSYKLGKSFSINFNPRTLKMSTDLGLLRSKDGKRRLKLKLNRNKIKATMTYKW